MNQHLHPQNIKADSKSEVRKPWSFLVPLDSIQNVTIFPPQNIHCKRKKKRGGGGIKNILALLLLLELFTIDFYYNISNNKIKKKIIIPTVGSESINWWMFHRESTLVLDLDKAEWVGGAAC